MQTLAEIHEIQTTLWSQISNRVKIELGAWGRSKITFDTTSPMIQMKTTNLGGLVIRITYNVGTDLYDVSVGKIRSHVFTEKSDWVGVDAGQLNDLLYALAGEYAR